EYAHANLKPNNWTQPTDIKTEPAFVVRNHIHYGDEEPSPTDDIYPAWYVGGTTGKATSTTIDKVSNELATSCTPAAAKEVIYNGNVATWNVDIFKGGQPNIGSTGSNSSGAASNAATDSVHNCNDSPPTVTLTAPSACTTSCTITATVTQGTHPLSDPQYPEFPGTVVFSLGGHTIHTAYVSNSPSTVSFPYSPSSSGSGTLMATITDSVLYSGSQSTPFTYSVTSPLSITSVGSSGTSASVQWTGGTGSFTAYLNGTASSSCQNVGGTSCTVTGLSPGPNSNSIFMQDSSGDKSSPVTVSGP
ncbi:MAG TPA: hypothetical protein VK712_03170, partial [Verrucomicrobiae bacterium]|nr:hypothetical protein [Verrucomicrobiae bacterium]